MAVSQQLKNILADYRVTTTRDLLRAIRDEYNLECFDPAETDLKYNPATGEFDEVPAKPFTLRDAENILEGKLEAEYQRIAGGAYDAPRLKRLEDIDFGAAVVVNGYDPDAAYERFLENGDDR